MSGRSCGMLLRSLSWIKDGFYWIREVLLWEVFVGFCLMKKNDKNSSLYEFTLILYVCADR